MAFQFSIAVRNARADAVESTIGASAKLKFFTGSEPANCAAADPAGLVGTINLPADWMAAAASGVKALAGSWSAAMTNSGTIACFRIYDSGGSTCHMQGGVTATDGGGDMEIDDVSPNAGQVVAVTTFSITEGNA